MKAFQTVLLFLILSVVAAISDPKYDEVPEPSHDGLVYLPFVKKTTQSPEPSSKAPENAYANDHTLFFRVFKGLINRMLASKRRLSVLVFEIRVRSVLRRLRSDAPSRLKKGLYAKYSKEEIENFINDLESYIKERDQEIQATDEDGNVPTQNIEDITNPSVFQQVKALFSFAEKFID